MALHRRGVGERRMRTGRLDVFLPHATGTAQTRAAHAGSRQVTCVGASARCQSSVLGDFGGLAGPVTRGVYRLFGCASRAGPSLPEGGSPALATLSFCWRR